MECRIQTWYFVSYFAERRIIEVKKTVLDYLEWSENLFPDKEFIIEQKRKITYREFVFESKKVASFLMNKSGKKGSVAIFIDKSINCMIAMFATLYSGNYYCVLDSTSPLERIEKICITLEPEFYLTEVKYIDKLLELKVPREKIICLDEMDVSAIDEVQLNKVRNTVIDTDPAYVLFTSGSTGIPKGTVVCHRAIEAYISSIVKTFQLSENVIWGSQTPFYFSMSILDVFSTIFVGGTLVIIPKMLFSFPVKLIEYMNQYEVNSIYWVPTALGIVANRNTFKAVKPLFLRKILFAGEVMPMKQLNYWRKHIENCLYANLYGPTEITDTGTYYIVEKNFLDSETLPIGVPFDNCDVFLLTADNKRAEEGEEGEICIRGSFLAHGYYNNWEKTQQVFCQNPLNGRYPEMIYRTGDIGKYNEEGELLYLCRKDFQIKRMGYRIELGELESVCGGNPMVESCACVFDKDTEKILLYYKGKIETKELREYIKEKLPTYLQPDQVFVLKNMPINSNGKIDRIKLLEEYKGEKND